MLLRYDTPSHSVLFVRVLQASLRATELISTECDNFPSYRLDWWHYHHSLHVSLSSDSELHKVSLWSLAGCWTIHVDSGEIIQSCQDIIAKEWWNRLQAPTRNINREIFLVSRGWRRSFCCCQLRRISGKHVSGRFTEAWAAKVCISCFSLGPICHDLPVLL